MVIAPDELYGIDQKIYLIQRYIDAEALKLWSGKIKIYGRIVDVNKTDGKVPAVHDAKIDYLELFVDDKSSASIAFLISEREVVSNLMRANVDIIFSVNTKDVYGENKHNDEKAVMEGYRMISSCGLVESISRIKYGIDDVLAGYNNDRIKYRDMAPWCMFSVSFEISYSQNYCKNRIIA